MIAASTGVAKQIANAPGMMAALMVMAPGQRRAGDAGWRWIMAGCSNAANATLPALLMPVPSFAPLTSSRLVIRPLREADVADLLEINGDPEVTQFLPYAPWQSLADGQAWFVRMNAMAQAGTAQQLVLELTDEHKVIGTLLYFHHDDKSARGELGYVLGRRHWGQGLMAEALQVFCGHAFGVAGVRRLEAEVNPANRASNTLLQRLGFTHEGRLRQRWVGKGAAYDTHFYGLLADEWLARDTAGDAAHDTAGDKASAGTRA